MHRMMSEAITLVMADMFLIEHSWIENSYNTNKRKIYPLFKSIPINREETDLFRVFKLMYSNAYYALIWDDYYFNELWVDKNFLEDYKEKYGIFFSADYRWNHENLINIDNKNKNLNKYFETLPTNITNYNTKKASKLIISDNKIIFNKMFWYFWGKFIDLLDFEEEYNHLNYMKKAIAKYISWQIKIFYDYNKFKLNISDINNFLFNIDNYSNESLLYHDYLLINKKIHLFIDKLEKEWIINFVDSKLYKLHYPHFDANFISYDNDKDSYLPIKQQFENIIGSENVEYNKLCFNDIYKELMTWKNIEKYNKKYLKKIKKWV
jgi:hypothetical protein